MSSVLNFPVTINKQDTTKVRVFTCNGCGLNNFYIAQDGRIFCTTCKKSISNWLATGPLPTDGVH